MRSVKTEQVTVVNREHVGGSEVVNIIGVTYSWSGFLLKITEPYEFVVRFVAILQSLCAPLQFRFFQIQSLPFLPNHSCGSIYFFFKIVIHQSRPIHQLKDSIWFSVHIISQWHLPYQVISRPYHISSKKEFVKFTYRIYNSLLCCRSAFSFNLFSSGCSHITIKHFMNI